MLELSKPLVIAAWPRNTRETMRVRLDVYQGNPVVDLRAWYPAPDGTLKPGKSGLTIGVKHLPALADALAAALAEARKRGLA